MRFTATRKIGATIGRRTLLALGAVVAAAMGLAACGSMRAYSADDYDRDAATSEQYYRDSRACEKQAEAHGNEHGFGPYDPTNGAYNRMFDACMRSSGYTRKKTVE
jgi:hypothetical protein